MPILWEWFKHVAILAHDVACIDPSSDGFCNWPPVYLAVVRGSLHRCSRLMLSVAQLSRGSKCAETVDIINRSIVETAIRIQWLCTREDADDAFSRYLVDGLRSDLILDKYIRSKIVARNGTVHPREQRMLDSIERCLSTSGMTRETVQSATARLPRFEDLLRETGYEAHHYIAIQRMLSHAVHGSWADLIFHYIEECDDGQFCLVDIDCAVPRPVQFTIPANVLTHALLDAFCFFITDHQLREEFRVHVEAVYHGLLEAEKLSWRSEDLEHD